MTPQQERKYLESVLQQIDNGAPSLLRSRWVELGLWLLTVAFMVTALQLSERVPLIITIGACLLVGILLGAYFLWQFAAKQWPFLRRHVSRESVVQRINDLES
jgi:hypothetical protein